MHQKYLCFPFKINFQKRYIIIIKMNASKVSKLSI